MKSENKHSFVHSVFTSVASKYDLMNNLMSFGVHHLWKNEMLKMIPSHTLKLLDVAGGTGDIARLYYQAARKRNIKPEITICDFNQAMLAAGQAKMIDHNILCGIKFVCGDAMSLPFPDNNFDCYSIAFGIRNVVDINQALKEAFRVLKPGGKFVCLEFSQVQNNLLRVVYDLYSSHIIPTLGQYVADDRASYQYLVDSIRKFPKQTEFLRMIQQIGFKATGYKDLSLGITALHYGYK